MTFKNKQITWVVLPLFLLLIFLPAGLGRIDPFHDSRTEDKEHVKDVALPCKSSQAPLQNHGISTKMGKQRGESQRVVGNGDELMRQIAGSALPDCNHACGGCTPCRRVAVSLKCLQESEACPMAYRCMCKGRSFPVP